MKLLNTIELGEIMLDSSDSLDPSKYPNELFDLYSIPAFDTGEPEIIRGSAIGSNKKVVQPGDVLLSRIVPHIRRSWMVGNSSERRSIASTEWIVFRNTRFHPGYLRHVLVSDPFHQQFMNTVSGVGGSLLRARPSYVAQIKIPFPPLAEQQRIAAILDRADDLRAKRRAALAHLDALTQSIFLDMFGDPITNPKSWSIRKAEDICQRITVGIVIQPASYYRGTGVPALRSLNIRTNRLETGNVVYVSPNDNETKLSKTRIWKDDILLVRSGQPGTAAIVPKELDGVNAIDILIVTPNQCLVLPQYLSFYFNSAGGKRMVLGEQRGQIQKHLNVGSLKVASIPVPPLSVQHEFVCRISIVEALKTAQQTSFAELDALFASLQHRAFRGEL